MGVEEVGGLWRAFLTPAAVEKTQHQGGSYLHLIQSQAKKPSISPIFIESDMFCCGDTFMQISMTNLVENYQFV